MDVFTTPIATTTTTTTIVPEIELWLDALTDTSPAHPLLWTGDGDPCAAHSLERLSVLISHIPAPDRAPTGGGDRYSFGHAEWSDHDRRPRWSQTMRLTSGWIVEVSTGGPGSFPRRVFRAAPGTAYPSQDVGDAPHPSELWSPIAAAEVIWAWEHGTLLDGCQTTLDYLTSEQRREFGL